jgi:phage FluMu protein Com
MSTFYRPLCPKCKTLTMLARITPGKSGFDIRTFECPACNRVHQRVVKLGDPMESCETAGWLHGELRAPT